MKDLEVRCEQSETIAIDSLHKENPAGNLRNLCTSKSNNESIPRSDEIFYRLGGSRVFSRLDMKTDFHKIRMRPEDI